MGNQFLSLSLFIMLLSFFIVLNAMSTIKVTKSQPVLSSLSLAFSSKENLKGRTTALTETPDLSRVSPQEKTGSSLDRLEGLFSTHITGVETKQNRFGTVLFARSDLKSFEQEVLPSDEPMPYVSDIQFLPMLRSLILSKEIDPYRMNLVVHVDEAQAGGLAERMQNLVQALNVGGISGDLLTIGLREAEEREDIGRLDFKFEALSSTKDEEADNG